MHVYLNKPLLICVGFRTSGAFNRGWKRWFRLWGGQSSRKAVRYHLSCLFFLKHIIVPWCPFNAFAHSKFTKRGEGEHFSMGSMDSCIIQKYGTYYLHQRYNFSMYVKKCNKLRKLRKVKDKILECNKMWRHPLTVFIRIPGTYPILQCNIFLLT